MEAGKNINFIEKVLILFSFSVETIEILAGVFGFLSKRIKGQLYSPVQNFQNLRTVGII